MTEFYRGSRSHYTDVGTRGQESLGIAVEYAKHPSGAGYFVIRFVAHADAGHHEAFTHFFKREGAKFLEMPGGQMPLDGHGNADLSKEFKGVRLNKIAIPVFAPAVLPWEVVMTGDLLSIWPAIGTWIQEQGVLEGFLMEDAEKIADRIRTMLQVPHTDIVTVTSVLAFPDLGEAKEVLETAKQKLKLVEKAEDDADEDEEEEEEEEEDEDTIQ